MDDQSNLSRRPVKVALGMHVIVDLILPGETERQEFDLVPDESADFTRGFLGIGTPLAKAIIGAVEGQWVPYHTGDIQQIRVLQVTPAKSAPPEDIQTRRQEVIRKAVDQSDRTNAIIFASSFSGKWGDYDPSSFVDDDGEPDSGDKK